MADIFTAASSFASAIANAPRIGMRALAGGASIVFTLRRADGMAAAQVTRALDANTLIQLPAPALFGKALATPSTAP